MWFYATISIHILSDSPLTVTMFTLLVVAGLCFSLTIVYFHKIKKHQCICTKDTYIEFEKPEQYMIYFQRLYQIIEGKKMEFNHIMTGNLFNHVQLCENKLCKCADML